MQSVCGGCLHSPSASDTLSDIEDIIARAPQHDCVVLLGDYNAKLPRNTGRRTGRWCIHNRANPAGTRLLELMERRQPCATYLPSISHVEVPTMRRTYRKTLDMGPPRLTTSWPPVCRCTQMQREVGRDLSAVGSPLRP